MLAKPIALTLGYKVIPFNETSYLNAVKECKKVIIIGKTSEIPPYVDINLKKLGKFQLRIYNELGEFYYLYQIKKPFVFNDLTNLTFEQQWRCSFSEEPIITTKANKEYIETYLHLPSVRICKTLPPMYIKAERTILKEYNYTLYAYAQAFNLYLLLYEGKYLDFLNNYFRIIHEK